MRTILAKGLLVALFALLLPASAALADGSKPSADKGPAKTSVTLMPGSLSMTQPDIKDFPVVQLDGTSKEVATTVGAFSVVDARGTGEGWHVIVKASDFTAAGSKEQGSTFASHLTLEVPEVTAVDTKSAEPGMAKGDIEVGGKPVILASAAPRTGMGRYDFKESKLSITVPADAYAGTYACTISFDVVSGP